MRKTKLIFALLLPLVLGMISALISARGMSAYGSMDKPPLSPPAWLFPVAWTILYLMMGLASYFAMESQTDNLKKNTALILYVIQLLMNFFWSIVFFKWGMYLWAFFWLIVMWAITIICTIMFYRIRKAAGYLLVPYVLWLAFAAYLNLGAFILS